MEREILYLADTKNHVIRKVTSGGAVTTLAGLEGTPGDADGSGNAARFAAPKGVAADSAGNVYVADDLNHTIRKITPAGVVTTLAGLAGARGANNGTGSAARFSNPRSVAVDSSGNVYVADTGDSLIRKITPGGTVSTLAGFPYLAGFADGTGNAALFNGPQGVAVDGAGNVFVADHENHAIRMITPGGTASTLAGTPTSGFVDGNGAAARFDGPTGITVDGAGNLYVADQNNHATRKITSSNDVTTLAGNGSRGFADGAGSTARFYSPSSTAVDGAGNVYLADQLNDTIRKITPIGEVSTVAGVPGRFYGPSGVAVDSSGNVYVADFQNHTIRRIGPDDSVSTYAGAAGAQGGSDAVGNAARFSFPRDVAVDGEGNLYVMDNGTRIRKIAPDRTVTTLAGSATAGSADGQGAMAQFSGAISASDIGQVKAKSGNSLSPAKPISARQR